MSYPQPPPSSHQLSDVLWDVNQENSDTREEMTNEEFYNQLYYLQTTEVSPSEAFDSTTFDATDSSANHPANTYDTGVLQDGYTAYYSQTPSASQPHPQSQLQLDPQPQISHSVPWNFQNVSNEIASLATSSYDIFEQSQRDYLQHDYASWITTIPEGAMFPIDIPLDRNYSMDTQQQFSDPEFIVGSSLQTIQQEAQPLYTPAEPTEGATLVPPPVRYDDDEIPRNDPSWLLKPQKHPWVQSGRAYLCPYDLCQLTIVQKKNKRRHNAAVHGHGVE